MDLPNIRKLVEKLTDSGVINDTTVKIINHFSHNANPTQSILEDKTKCDGFLVSYDGRSIIFAI